jgi:predicted dehydrogenase
MNYSRRNFIKESTCLVAGATLLPGADLQAGLYRPMAADKINVGLIGCKNRGFSVLRSHLAQPDVNCVALCDVDQQVLESRAAEVEKLTGKKPTLFSDYRKLLENKDIDAVIIGTPDHWHCLMMVDACAAGKDVYVEKPMANSIAECDIMVKAAHRYNRVVQVGQQQRSSEPWRTIIPDIQTGKIGQLRKINVWANFEYGIGSPKQPDSAVPAGVDYDMWLGPAPKRPFNTNHFHGVWRHFWAFGGGITTDWGVHLIDMALWAGKVAGAPKSVYSVGGNFSYPDYSRETPDTLSSIFDMGNFVMTWNQTAGTQNGPYGQSYGVEFIGNNGTIVANRGGWELRPETKNNKSMVEAVPFQKVNDPGDAHTRNFLDCVKSRSIPVCSVETGRLAALYTHLANISLRTNSRLIYDEQKMKVEGNKEATQLLSPSYRSPWKLPVV